MSQSSFFRPVLLSVVLCTYNNDKRLSVTMESLRLCNIPEKLNWQLVVVNNNCTDETDSIVEKYCQILPITYVHEPMQGLSRARNAGINASKGEFIVFIDDDVRPVPKWLEVYWNAYLERPEGYYFGGPVESEFESERPAPDVLKMSPTCIKGLSYGIKSRQLEGHSYFLAANWGCPASALQVVGGYDVSKGLNPTAGRLITGEETDLMDRLQGIGYRPWYLADALIYHFVPRNKTTLRHIANKIEAISFCEAQKCVDRLEGKRIFGVPRWMYKRLISLYARYYMNKLKGDSAALHYIKARRFLGEVKFHYYQKKK
ncbi:MAG: glycosyltransferase [Deltaproteobacteria bacterium]|nr:glycosyltransferase [Deltaproteobacteria bacterium]